MQDASVEWPFEHFPPPPANGLWIPKHGPPPPLKSPFAFAAPSPPPIGPPIMAMTYPPPPPLSLDDEDWLNKMLADAQRGRNQLNARVSRITTCVTDMYAQSGIANVELEVEQEGTDAFLDAVRGVTGNSFVQRMLADIALSVRAMSNPEHDNRSSSSDDTIDTSSGDDDVSLSGSLSSEDAMDSPRLARAVQVSDAMQPLILAGLRF